MHELLIAFIYTGAEQLVRRQCGIIVQITNFLNPSRIHGRMDLQWRQVLLWSLGGWNGSIGELCEQHLIRQRVLCELKMVRCAWMHSPLRGRGRGGGHADGLLAARGRHGDSSSERHSVRIGFPFKWPL